MLLPNPIVPPQGPLGLTRRSAIGGREILDALDMGMTTLEDQTVIDPVGHEARDVQRVVDARAVGVDHSVRSDTLPNDRHERSLLQQSLQIRWHDGIDPACALQNTEDDDFTGRSTTAFSLAGVAKVGFIAFDFPFEGTFTSDALGDGLAEFVVVERGGVTVDPDKFSGVRAGVPATKCSRSRCCVAWGSLLRRRVMAEAKPPDLIYASPISYRS